MTTNVHDFGSPERTTTSPYMAAPQDQQRHATFRSHSSIRRSSTVPDRSSSGRQPRSPTTIRDDFNQDRRESVMSHLTTMSSNEGGVRHRRPDRSNTITSYHQPELPQPGAEPGIDTTAADELLPAHLKDLKAACDINIFDISLDEVRHHHATNVSLESALDDVRDPSLPCRWISVNGLDWDVIKCISNKYSLHRLAVEDLCHTHSRTKVDWYADHAFVVLTLQKLVRLHQHKGQEGVCDFSASSGQYDSGEDDDVKQVDKQRSGSNQSRKSWKQVLLREKQFDVLPRYAAQNAEGKMTEFVQAHSGVSEDSPIKPIRTLHRYESAQIPEHTAWMEKHSVLADEDLAVSVEQVSIFLLADNTVISFFEHSADDVETPIVKRLQSYETMLRRSCDASLVLQAIIDAIVDLAVPVKDAYNKTRKELQIDAMTNPDIKTSRALHIFGEEIDMLQNLFKPIVHLVNALREHNAEPLPPAPPVSAPPIKEEHDEKNQPKKQTKRDREGAPIINRSITDIRKKALNPKPAASSVSISPIANTYFGDVLDHCITIIGALEQMDASASNISTLIFNTVGAKTNNFMMILAVVTVFFAPLTFVSGYFGMNFAEGQGLKHPFAYFWVIAIPSLVAFMLVVFATMLWDNIRDFFAKRGIRQYRRARRHRR